MVKREPSRETHLGDRVRRDVLYKQDAAVWFVPIGVRVRDLVSNGFTPIIGVNDTQGVNCWLVQAPGDELAQLWALKWIRRDGTSSNLEYRW